MKRRVTMLIAGGALAATLFLSAPFHASALSLYQPFAGRVLSTFAAGVSCRGEGPIMIQPVGLSIPPGPYVIQVGQTKRYQYYTVHSGSWVLGLYSPSPSLTSCATDTLPPVPVPVFPIKLFGSSL